MPPTLRAFLPPARNLRARDQDWQSFALPPPVICEEPGTLLNRRSSPKARCTRFRACEVRLPVLFETTALPVHAPECARCEEWRDPRDSRQRAQLRGSHTPARLPLSAVREQISSRRRPQPFGVFL